MEFQTKTKITRESLKKIKYSTLAEKYNCSVGYVRMILLSEREQNTIRAQKILKDVTDILEILERKTTITL